MSKVHVSKSAKGLAGVVLAVAALIASVLFAPSPALADTYKTCEYRISPISAGTTSKTQSITCAMKPACGQSWGQIYDVTWTMTSSSSGVTVKKIKLTVTHTQGEDITIGKKVVVGANRSLDLGAWDQVPAGQTSWTKTYDPADTYLSKRADGTVQFSLATSSSKDNGCNVGWRTLLFQLQL